MPASDMERRTAEMLPCELAHAPLTMEAVMTVIGPVGPEIWEWVPPKRAAKKPSRVAPTSPAKAPMLEASGLSTPPNA